MEGEARSAWAVAGQVLAILVAGSTGLLSAGLAFLLLSARLGPPNADPHGYTLIFGSLLIVPASVVGSLALPFVVPGRMRRERRVAVIAGLVWLVGALVLAGFALTG